MSRPDLLVLLAHGSRDPAWREPIDALAARVRGRLPGVQVACAFLEFMAPSMDGALEGALGRKRGGEPARVAIAPVFLARGAHLERDLRMQLASLAARHPRARIEQWPALGDREAVLEAVASDYLRQWSGGGRR